MAASSSKQQPLALEYHGDAPGTGQWRRHAELIDALAYVDPLTPDVKQRVDALIAEEMRLSSKRPADYEKELPAALGGAAPFEGRPLLAAEYERVAAAQPMPPLDTARFRLDPPPQEQRGDPSAWQKAVDNAHAQLEHQLTRVANLELLLKYGANAWRAQTSFDEALSKQLEAELASLRKSIDALNRGRKLQQQAAGEELARLEDRYYSALRKNLEIDAAAQAVEDEVARLQARCRALGGGGGEQQQQQEGAGAAAGGAAEAAGQQQQNGVP